MLCLKASALLVHAAHSGPRTELAIRRVPRALSASTQQMLLRLHARSVELAQCSRIRGNACATLAPALVLQGWLPGPDLEFPVSNP